MKYFIITLVSFFTLHSFGAIYQTGFTTPIEWKNDFTYQNPTIETELPGSYDSREVLGKNTPPIKDQGNCGSCWAFGTVAGFEFAFAKVKGSVKQFSEQELVSCSEYGSCGGGYFAHEYHVKPGGAVESDFPYVARDVKCKKGLKQDEKLKTFYMLGTHTTAPTEFEIKTAIFKYGAVVATVYASDALMNYKSGVFKKCRTGITNHIITLVGWGKGSGKTYWILRNSWGEGWGEKGYMKIPAGCSKVAEDASYVIYQE